METDAPRKKTLMELFADTDPDVEFAQPPSPLPAIAAAEQNPTYDTTEDKKEAEGILYLSPNLLDPFHADPFRPYTGRRFSDLVDSIRERGILSYIHVRPKKDGRYEILSGRNRNNAAKLLNMESVPCILKDVDDDEAVLIVTDSNLNQREELLPSEKAFAYKMQMEALKKQGKNTEKYEEESDDCAEIQNNCHDGKNIDNQRSIYRYIRLTFLLDSLLQLIDGGYLALVSGEELSFLDQDEQATVHQYFFEEKRGVLDVKTARLIRQRASEVDLTYLELEKLLRKAARSQEIKAISLRMTKINKYIPSGFTKKETEKYIVDAVEFYTAHKDDFK